MFMTDITSQRDISILNLRGETIHPMAYISDYISEYLNPRLLNRMFFGFWLTIRQRGLGRERIPLNSPS